MHTDAAFEGEVINAEGLRRRQMQAQKATHVYYMQIAPNMIIDARHKGNVARLINNSCNPNCETQKWTDATTGKAAESSQWLAHKIFSCQSDTLSCGTFSNLLSAVGALLIQQGVRNTCICDKQLIRAESHTEVH